jgi:hypothetical protein
VLARQPVKRTIGAISPKRVAIWPLGSPNGQENTPS